LPDYFTNKKPTKFYPQMSEKENLQEVIDRTKLQMKVETIERHHAHFRSQFDELFVFMQDFKVSLVRIENNIEKTADLPERVRKIEDKGILTEVIKVGIGIAIGALISGYANQNLVPTREKNEFKTEQTK